MCEFSEYLKQNKKTSILSILWWCYVDVTCHQLMYTTIRNFDKTIFEDLNKDTPKQIP